MISRRAWALRPLSRTLTPAVSRPAFTQTRCASAFQSDPSVADPNMNGGYVNPPPGKRALRDPYADWWDKQERRNFGEALHEDNDIYTVFSTEPYTHSTPGKAGFHFLCFVAVALGLCGVTYQYYPDTPTVPKTYPDGLEVELGGKEAVLAAKPGDDNAQEE